jgi:hypothetical protein
MIELRCDSKILHGILEEEFVEVACKSGRCGKRSGVVVLHKFNTKTGQLVSTRLFKEPEPETQKEVSNGNRSE